MIENKLISVIIPTYNDGKYLKLAIESIQNQTYDNIEIIVVDDFSTDETKIIVDEISKNDRRVMYYLNDFEDPKRLNKDGVNVNAGYSARNFGLSKAKGSWITFQDGDDISFLNRLEIQLGLVKKFNVSHLTNSVVWFREKYISKKFNLDQYIEEFPLKDNLIRSEEISHKAESGIGILSKFLPTFLFSRIPFVLKRKRFISKLFFKHQLPYIGAAGATFFKKELIQKVKFRQIDYREWPSLKGRGADRDFNYNLAFTFKDSLFVDIPLYCWRTPSSFKDKYNIERFLK